MSPLSAIPKVLFIQATITYNQVIHFLQNLPFIGRIFPQWLYHSTLAGGFRIISLFVMVQKQILGKALYFGVISGLAYYVAHDGADDLTYPMVFKYGLIVLSLIAGTFLRVSVLAPADTQDQLFIAMLRMQPTPYFLSKVRIHTLQILIFYMPMLVIFGLFFGIHPLEAIAFTCLLLALRYLAQILYVHTFNLRTAKNSLHVTLGISMIILSSIMVALHEPLLLIVPLDGPFHPLLIPGGIAIVLLSELYLQRLKKYEAMASVAVNYSEIKRVQEQVQNVSTHSVKLDDDDIKLNAHEEADAAYKGLSGIEYINRIFFDRLKHVFHKKRRPRLLLSYGYVLLGTVGIGLMRYLDKLPKDASFLDEFPTIVTLVLLFCSIALYMGEEFTKLCFYHMDRYLMKLNFYREPQQVRRAMSIRFQYALKLNAPVYINILLGTLAAYYLLGGRALKTYILIVVFATITMLFYSLYHLIIYYLLQPYTENMMVKSPVSYFLDGLMGSIPFLAFSLHDVLRIDLFLMGTMGLFILVGGMLISWFAPKNFKLRT